MVTGRLYTSTNILVTPCSFVCNRDRLSKNAREKIADLASQLLAMPEKGNLLARLAATAEAQEALVQTPGYSAHMRNVAYVQSFAKGATAADHVETNPAVGVALQTLKEAHPDVDQALQKIQKTHSVTKGLVDSYCRKQISKLLKQAAAKKEAAKEAAEATAKERAAKEAAPQGHEPKGGDKNKRKRTKLYSGNSCADYVVVKQMCEQMWVEGCTHKSAKAIWGEVGTVAKEAAKKACSGDFSLLWQDYGHEWLNKRVTCDYGTLGTNQGTITMWIPAGKDPIEDMALWHVTFDDGDKEDLEKNQVEEALLQGESQVEAFFCPTRARMCLSIEALGGAEASLAREEEEEEAAAEEEAGSTGRNDAGTQLVCRRAPRACEAAKLLKQAAAKKEAAKEAAEATAKERAAKEAASQGHEPKGGDKNKRKRTKGSDEDEVVEDSLQAELDNLNVGIKAVALDVGWREIRKVLDDKASDAPHGGKEANWAKQWGTASGYTKDHVCELLAKGDKVLLHHMAQVRKKQKPHFLLLHGSEVFDPPANGTCMFACLVRLIQASGKVGLLKHMGVTKHLPQGTIPTQPDHVMAKLMKVAQPLIVRFEKSMSKGKARRYFEGGAEALSEESSISSQGGSKRRSSRNKDSDSQGQVNSGLDIQIQKLMHGHIDHLACCDGEWLQDCMGCNRFHSSGLGDWKGNAALGEWEDNAFGGADELADETQHCALGGAAALAALANKANKANKAAAVRRLVREVLSSSSLGDLTTHIVRQRVEAYMGRQVEEYNALISQEMCCYMLEVKGQQQHAVEVQSEQQQQLAKQTAPEQQIEAAAAKKKVRKKPKRPRTNKPIKSAKSAPAPNARSSTPGRNRTRKSKLNGRKH